MNGILNKIIPFSSVDGPGNRTAIFLQGCNLNCLYCHNPETINNCIHCGICVEHCPVKALSIENGKVIWDAQICINCDNCIKICPHTSSPKTIEVDADMLYNMISKHSSFISGITVSGGECTLQDKLMVELFKKIKMKKLTCFVDSNGYKDFEAMPELTDIMDMAMIDLKAFDLNDHIKLTGKSNETVIKNIEYLAGIKKLYEIRTVVVPELIDNEKTVFEGSKLLAAIDPDIRYKIIKYRPMGVRTELINSNTPDDEYMEYLANIARQNGLKNIILV